ncbi:MAG TPA: NADH-quinone oxidoreductase subunit C [Planctomycetota bacterium]
MTGVWWQQVMGAESVATRDGMPSVRVPAERWLELANAAANAGYARFLDLTVVDEPSDPARFQVLLTLYSFAARGWLRLRTRTPGPLASVTSLFAAANWYEREAFDLFGVHFDGHPDLTRILLPDDYPSHPLRADHPLGDEPIDFTVTREVDSQW